MCQNNISTCATHKEKLFFMFMMFLWVAQVSPLTGFNYGKNPIFMPVYMLILFYYYYNYCKRTIKPLIVYCCLFLVWLLIYSIYKGGNGFGFIPIYNIIIAHIAFNLYEKNEFLSYFQTLLSFFSIISLIVWTCANLLGAPFVDFMHAIAIHENTPPTETYSVLFGLGSQFELGLRRNIGFTWEPGIFSCWLLIGLYINLIQTKFNIGLEKNKTFWLFVIALFTTFSTTGYACISIIIVFYLINKSSVINKYFVIAVVISIVPVIADLSFMADKIIGLTDIDAGFSSIDYHNREGAEIICPQRFTGIYCSYMNFINDFLFGFNKNELSYTSVNMFHAVVAPSEGVISILGQYGIFVGLFFYYWLYKSSVFLAEKFKYKGKLIFFIFFVAISISYSFWFSCILMYFYLSAFYHKYSNEYF